MPTDTETMALAARTVLEDVLETMFFTSALAVDCRHEPGSISARVHFNGAPSGEFELTLSPGAARQFALAFLACDEPELPSDAEAQVSCEMANMICGAALSRMHPDAVVKLNAPYVCDPASPLDGAHQCFETPEGMLSVTMRVN